MRRFRALWEASWGRQPGDAFPWHTSDLPDATRELLESNVVPKGRAVDIGCGDGVLAVMISARGWATVGVDLGFFDVAPRVSGRKNRAIAIRMSGS